MVKEKDKHKNPYLTDSFKNFDGFFFVKKNPC